MVQLTGCTKYITQTLASLAGT